MTPRHAPSGNVVLLTGASSGIGAITADRLVRASYRVYGTSRHQHADRDGVRMVQMDVRDDESIANALAAILDEAEHIDVLINNAGVVHPSFTEEIAPDQATDMFETNFFGATRVINAILPHMRERRQGRIINVGSLAAWVGEPGEGFYAASKAAIARYTEALRHEVWHLGIGVSLVEPGTFRTNVLDANVGVTDPDTTVTDYDGAREAAVGTLQANLERGGDPQHVADLITRVVRERAPKARYPAGQDARWIPLLTTLLPQRLVDRLLRRAYRLPTA